MRVRLGLGYIATAADNAVDANMAQYGADSHTPEELAAIRAVIAPQAAAWQAGQSANLNAQATASAAATARAAEVNAILCRTMPAGQCSMCFADAYRQGMTAFGDTAYTDDYNHLGVSCTRATGQRWWFNKSMSAAEIASMFAEGNTQTPQPAASTLTPYTGTTPITNTYNPAGALALPTGTGGVDHTATPEVAPGTLNPGSNPVSMIYPAPGQSSSYPVAPITNAFPSPLVIALAVGAAFLLMGRKG